MSGPVLVAGASGFVGRRLCPALVDAGFEVRAMTRQPQEYRGAGEAVGADASDAPALRAALLHCGAAYYLVHSLASADFEAKDAAAAGAFGEAAAQEGVGRIIYLGGQGADDDNLSAHLRSRRRAEAAPCTPNGACVGPAAAASDAAPVTRDRASTEAARTAPLSARRWDARTSLVAAPGDGTVVVVVVVVGRATCSSLSRSLGRGVKGNRAACDLTL